MTIIRLAAGAAWPKRGGERRTRSRRCPVLSCPVLSDAFTPSSLPFDIDCFAIWVRVFFYYPCTSIIHFTASHFCQASGSSRVESSRVESLQCFLACLLCFASFLLLDQLLFLTCNGFCFLSPLSCSLSLSVSGRSSASGSFYTQSINHSFNWSITCNSSQAKSLNQYSYCIESSNPLIY
jgi:hypothetical protein